MERTNFEKLRVYRLSENAQTEGLKPMVEESAPMLNAYLNSIGPMNSQAVSKKPVGEPGNY